MRIFVCFLPRFPALDTSIKMIFNFFLFLWISFMEFCRRCYSNQLVSDRYAMPECFIQPGHLCCVRISEDKWWYRVIIHRILGKQEVEVFYPDFGNIGTVQKSSLRFLKWVNKFIKNNWGLNRDAEAAGEWGPLFLFPCLSFLPSFLLSADLANGRLASQLDLLCFLSHGCESEWTMRLNFILLLTKWCFGSCWELHLYIMKFGLFPPIF